MTIYYIQTFGGKEGPFSIEELRKKDINSDTLISEDGTIWTPAGTIRAIKQIISETGPPLHFKKLEGPKYIFTADAISEPKTRSRISALQWAAIVLLALNVLVYYYKKSDSVISKSQEVVQLSEVPLTPEKKIIAIQSIVNPAINEERENKDTINSNIRNNWATFIKATHNDFKFYSKYGGIHHLKAIVQNNSDFPLDTVKLAIKYIKQGQTFKTEYVTLYNVPEQGELSVHAPTSKSGTSVTLDITEITSQKLQFFYSADIPVKAGPDPFFRL